MAGGGLRVIPVDGIVAKRVNTPLYQDKQWIKSFFALVQRYALEHRDLAGDITLNLERQVPVLLTLEEDGGTATVGYTDVSYFDMLLAHTSLAHPVEALLDEAVQAAAASDTKYPGTLAELRHRLIPDLYSKKVRESLRSSDLSRLYPIGVSGHLTGTYRGRTHHLLVRRSHRVAVSPGAWALPVEGGADDGFRQSNPVRDIVAEHKSEFPDIEGETWELIGFFVPGNDDPDTTTVKRSGANILFRKRLDNASPRQLLNALREDFDPATSPYYETAAIGTVRWSDKDGALIHAAGDSPGRMAEPVAETAWVVIRDFEGINSTERGTTAMTDVANPIALADRSGPAVSEDRRSLEDRFGDEQIGRFKNLQEATGSKEVLDMGEAQAVTEEMVLQILRIVANYRMLMDHRGGSHLGHMDAARLFEALVYRVSANLFAGKKDVAEEALAWLHQSPDAVSRELGPSLLESLIKQYRRKADDEVVVDKALAETIEAARADEQFGRYSRLLREAKLLCFCCVLWLMEAESMPGAADRALNEKERIDLIGEPIALFFRARALLISPVASDAQTQLGYEYIRAALSKYPNNAGMHHTAAIYQLRRAQTTTDPERAKTRLGEALDDIDRAIIAEPEWPIFYVTRAKIKRLVGETASSLIDLQTAVELARYVSSSDIKTSEARREWTELLEQWRMAV